MKAVVQKAFADLWGRGWQSLLIVVTIGTSAMLLYLGIMTIQSSSSPYEKQMAAANGPHAWLFLTGGAEGESLAARIGQLPGVTEASDLRPMTLANLIIPGEEKTPRIALVALSVQPKMARHIILRGRDLARGDDGAAVLDASVARSFRINVGDQVQISTANGVKPLHVVGLHAEPMMCQYPDCQPVSVYVTPESFAAITQGQETSLEFGVQLKNPEQAAEFLAQADQQANGKARVTAAVSWLDIGAFVRSVQSFNAILILVFGVMAIIASTIVTLNIVAGAVLAQYKEIGILKSLGFTRGQIFALFVGQNLLLALIGGMIGSALGHVTAINVLKPLAENMGIADPISFNAGLAGSVVLLILLLGGLSAMLAAWGAIVTRPAQLMAAGFSAPRARMSWIVRLLVWLRLPPVIPLGVKDAVARPGRAVMTVLSLVFCLVTVAMSVSITNLIDRFSTDAALSGNNYDLKVEPGGLKMSEAERLIGQSPAVQGYYTEAIRAATAVDQGVVLGFKCIGGDWSRFDFSLLQGRMLQGSGEVLLGSGASDKLGVRIGDKLSVRLDGKVSELTVVGTYREMSNLGQMGIISLETLRQVSPEAVPEMAMVKVKSGVDVGQVRIDLLQAANYGLNVEFAPSGVPGFAKGIPRMVGLLALLMAAIAGLSVLNTALLTAREQLKEAGIKKAIGMTPGQILLAIGAGGVWLGLWGALLGIPAGMGLNRLLILGTAQSVGVTVPNVGLPAGYLALLLIVSVGLAGVSTMPAAVWAGRLPPSVTLRSE